MADFASSQSTVIQWLSLGSVKGAICQYAATTGFASDTVVTPLTRVLFASPQPLSSGIATTATPTLGWSVNLSTISTAAGNIIVSHTTYAGKASLRYLVIGY